MKIAIPVSTSKTQCYINFAYIDFIKKAGHEPIMISEHNSITDVIETCHGLLLPGGIDIDPIRYGENNIASFSTDVAKDKFERNLLWTFASEGKPIMGICRGFQLIVREFLNEENDYNNPDFIRLDYSQHILNHSLAKDREVPRSQPTHWVLARNGLYNNGDNGATYIPVNSMHHQVLKCDFDKKDGKNMKSVVNMAMFNGKFNIMAVTDFATAIKYKGCIIEAVEVSGWLHDDSRILAVQWHPEELCTEDERDLGLLNNIFDDGVNVTGTI